MSVQIDHPTIMDELRAFTPICESRAADCCLDDMTDEERRESVHDMILDHLIDHSKQSVEAQAYIAQVILNNIMGEPK